MSAPLAIVRVTPPARPALAEMTFPIYRRLLDLTPTTRHPEQGDTRPIQPVALAALVGGEPVGLALAELPLAPDDLDRAPEMLSLFVRADRRGQGIGGALVAALVERVRETGAAELRAVYTTGKPEIDHLERIFARCGFEPPAARTLSVRFAPAAALASELFDARRLAALGRGLEIFPWAELSAAARERALRSNAELPWITPALAPWRFERQGYDASSVGATYRGELVGWVINHQVAPDTVRWTCSFMRQDLSHRARILPLYRATLKRLVGTPLCQCTFVTPLSYAGMIGLVRRWIVPFASFVGETRGACKRLATATGPELAASQRRGS